MRWHAVSFLPSSNPGRIVVELAVSDPGPQDDAEAAVLQYLRAEVASTSPPMPADLAHTHARRHFEELFAKRLAELGTAAGPALSAVLLASQCMGRLLVARDYFQEALKQ